MSPERRPPLAGLLAALLALGLVAVQGCDGTANDAHDHEADGAHDHDGHSEADTPDPDPDPDREIAYWVAPMDSSYRRDEPGKSPMGMDLVPVYKDELTEPGEVRVATRMQQAMNIRTTTARRDRLSRQVDTVGRVALDESGLQRFNPRVAGWIQQIDVASEGEPVREGQRLFTLYSQELVSAQDEFLQALRRDEPAYLESALARLRALGVQSAVIDTLRERQATLQEVPWHAPADGVVTRLGARRGMFVDPGHEILEVANLATVWVVADVFARHADWLAVGDSAEIHTPYHPGTQFRSSIDYIYPLLDERTRTVQVRVPVDNPDLRLSPGMWTGVRLRAAPGEEHTVIPREALIRTGQAERLVLRLDSDLFEVREVVSGMESGDEVAIRSGLEPGEEVVISGHFLIDSEASIEAGHGRLEAHDH